MESKLIRDKVIVLFVLHYSEGELSNSELSEMLLQMDDMDYFRLQEALNDLSGTGLVETRTVPGTTYYRITPEGEATLEQMKSEIHKTRLEKLFRLVGKSPEMDPDRLRPLADFFPVSDGSFSVRCRIVRGTIPQMELTLKAPSEEAAKMICLNWSQKSQKVYETIMEELL